MKIAPYAVQKLRKIVTGDDGITPNQSGRDLISFFGSFGIRDVYSAGLPENMSRNDYTESRLTMLNGTEGLANLLQELVSERHFDNNGMNRDVAVAEINRLITPDGYKLSFIGGKYEIIGNSSEVAEVIKNTVHFEEIQKKILAELDRAKFTIWVAVAWFTDPILFNKLIEKKKHGVNVQVIIINDEINVRGGLHFEDFFETKRVKKTGYFENITHHKFCVIDLERVINGSYNWTVKAQYNEENVTIMDDRKTSLEFAERFINLKTE